MKNKTKDLLAYLAQIQAYLAQAVNILIIWEDAMTCPDIKLWQVAWDLELQSIIDWDIFNKPVIVSNRYNVIMAKVVWDIKYVEDGSITRYKARFVGRDFTQVYKVDYEEKFTLIICYNAFCIFLAIATKNNWKVY